MGDNEDELDDVALTLDHQFQICTCPILSVVCKCMEHHLECLSLLHEFCKKDRSLIMIKTAYSTLLLFNFK